ncbi:hypothetical protein L6452_13150 [Arctium lappa]|uniref:Uncharacterized protein n=1 Tax=Arctium lappa TaxID=4217 RepID=A0ACB9CHF0_ARCLA|nr:hypothetical protein L6452_13150 [Arctium lappa]
MTSIGEVEQIPLPHILSATENFDKKNFIAAGGFGKVYKGHSEQYGTIAVKRSMAHSMGGHGQGQHHFMMEIELLSAYKHENLVSLASSGLRRGAALQQGFSTSEGNDRTFESSSSLSSPASSSQWYMKENS